MPSPTQIPFPRYGRELQAIAVVVSIALGLGEAPVILSLLIGILAFSVLHTYVRWAELVKIWKHDGVRMFLMIGIHLFYFTVFAGVLYGIGRGIASFS